MKKSVKLAWPHGEFKHRYWFFATALNIARNCSVICKIYDGEPILTVFLNIGEDVQYRCFKQVYYVNSVSQPDIMPILENNYCLQMIETGFAEQL
jgi:hypothetical protein